MMNFGFDWSTDFFGLFQIGGLCIGYAECVSKERVDWRKGLRFGSMGGKRSVLGCLSLEILVGILLIFAVHLSDETDPGDGKEQQILLYFKLFCVEVELERDASFHVFGNAGYGRLNYELS